MNITAFSYNDQTINQRADDFLNLTQMCQANGKLIGDWQRLKSTKAYIQVMVGDMGITTSDVLETYKGGSPQLQGTWGHPELAIHLAQWISPKFHRWCNAHIFNLMVTGKTTIDIDPLEEMRLKLKVLEAEERVAIAQKELIDTRYLITQTAPEVIQQKVLGYQTIEKVVEKTIVYKESEFLRDDSTINKTSLCRRYGITTKAGKPDYPRLNKILATVNLPQEAWKTIKNVQENAELRIDYLGILDNSIVQDSRQLWIGE